MKMTFTVNITRVNDPENDVELDNRMRHYALFPAAFANNMQDVEHELECEDGTLIYFEMEDIDPICDICQTYPCTDVVR